MKHAQADTITVDAPAYETVVTDKRRLKIILSNLISNALKYARKGNLHQVQVSYWKDPDKWWLKVSDNGTGIPEEYRPRIFDMFFRASNQSEGSGLGLYIVKESLEKLNGTIYMESRVGSGSSFTIGLPVVQDNR
ncbi:MAG: HAMP domain-containing histidine kinase [Bacteroidetes bacterium]|nr:HAMP domain-containing histidine kinase [Bacteroidota bacterium]